MVEVAPEKPDPDGTEIDKNSNAAGEDKEEEKPLATSAEVFSFIPNFRVKIYIVIGMFSAVVSGVVFPAIAFLFSGSFSDLSGAISKSLTFVFFFEFRLSQR